MKYCGNCGETCKDEYEFCPNCGAVIPVIVAEPVVEQPIEEVVAEPVVEQPIEEVVAEPVVEQPKEEVVTELVVEQPKEEVVAEPVVEQPIEEVAAEPVVEQPKEEVAVVVAEKEADPKNNNISKKDEKYFRPVPPEGKGKCTAGLSLGFGLISLLFFWIPGVNVVVFVLSIFGIIFGGAATRHYRYGAAIAGKTLSIFALIFNIILVGIFVAAVYTGNITFEGFLPVLEKYLTFTTSLIKEVGNFLASFLLVQ